jgi:hypothetical protein
MRRNREYSSETEKTCRGRGSHRDAVALVEYLFAHGGKSTLTAQKIAEELHWERRLGSMRQTDMPRFHLARNHVRDGRIKGRPCTGYSLHYRTSRQGNEWRLIDPTGGLEQHLEAGYREISGDLQQQVAFRTINGRRIATAEQMAEMCLKATPMDGIGHRVMLEYAMELRKFGAVSDQLLAEINQWLSTARAENA